MKIKVVNNSINKVNQFKLNNKTYIEIVSNADAAIIKPFEIATLSTGLFFTIPKGYEAQLRTVKNLALSKNILIMSFETIDNDFTGELLVPLINLSGQNQLIMRGEVIAHLVVNPIELIEIEWGEVRAAV